jgi:hypothetical protein
MAENLQAKIHRRQAAEYSKFSEDELNPTDGFIEVAVRAPPGEKRIRKRRNKAALQSTLCETFSALRDVFLPTQLVRGQIFL